MTENSVYVCKKMKDKQRNFSSEEAEKLRRFSGSITRRRGRCSLSLKTSPPMSALKQTVMVRTALIKTSFDDFSSKRKEKVFVDPKKTFIVCGAGEEKISIKTLLKLIKLFRKQKFLCCLLFQGCRQKAQKGRRRVAIFGFTILTFIIWASVLVLPEFVWNLVGDSR